MPLSDSYPLHYNPELLPRELKEAYISADENDIQEMLATIGLKNLSDLYQHIDGRFQFADASELPDALPYEAVMEKMAALSEKNKVVLSFLGDGLPQFKQPDLVADVSAIRNLTTAYTPYQPERSQGTLYAHWVYQCLMSQLTGFEAINSSLYDRATALFEAICTAIRIHRKADTVILPNVIYPGDMEVIKTLIADTDLKIRVTPVDVNTGNIDKDALVEAIESLGTKAAGVVIPQVNHFGHLEPVDALTHLVHGYDLSVIGVVDPMLLATGGLKAPSDWGVAGADLIVGEAQHLALDPAFGGPGLGLFGIRYHDKCKNDIRHTPGRYVGKAFDLSGRECRVMVLSTREQHIRKEKATSNICSNQAFIATLVGAALLARGESGMSLAVKTARENAVWAFEHLTALDGVDAAFPNQAFFNEFTLSLSVPVGDFIEKARQEGIHVGIDVSDRIPGVNSFLKLSFSDCQDEADLARLLKFFESTFKEKTTENTFSCPSLDSRLMRLDSVGLPELSKDEIKTWYERLGELNASPDDAPYPLGSCTMKYNPYLNDWAAALPGFNRIHPQAPEADVQGSLEVLFEIQEWFKGITGLPGVTTQPVAGAQGELVGIKLFQAYHRSRGDLNRRVILIPRSAHGTNFASAAMAGFTQGKDEGIVYLDAESNGSISITDLDAKISQYGERIAGIMITNPNTSGVFETRFRLIADKIHAIGGLVYMDGANMNAIAGRIDLDALGVDAVHNNLHKTWSISHGGGGPGDGFVAVSALLVDFLPGHQVVRTEEGGYRLVKPAKSIGSFHRHHGNFAHKIRCLAYLSRLGGEGVRKMSAVAVLSARYLFERLRHTYCSLPAGAGEEPRMHEFILTLSEAEFKFCEAAGIPRASVIPRVGKVFLDFGFHAPTVAWPEVFGLMIEPTESYTKAELDRFADAVLAIHKIATQYPEVLEETPYFTPVDRVDEVAANRQLCLSEKLTKLPDVHPNRVDPSEIEGLSIEDIFERIIGHVC